MQPTNEPKAGLKRKTGLKIGSIPYNNDLAPFGGLLPFAQVQV
jgi:hypothetical protein